MSHATLPQPSLVTQTMLPHIVDAIDNADVSDKPFSHLFAQQIFPANVYSEMLDNLPDPATYEPKHEKQLPDGTYTRTYYQLDRDGLAALPDHQRALWESVVDALLSEDFKVHVFRQLRKDLAFRFRTQDVEAIEASPRPRIVRDVSGYKIDPHPDTRKKAVTMMIYLPRDERQKDLGTSLYKIQPSLQGLTSKRRWFKEVKRFPFIPNSAFAFAVNNCLRKKSWHGRELVEKNVGVRNSLVTTFYVPEAVNYDRY